MISESAASLPNPTSLADWQELLHELLEGQHAYIVDKLGSPAEVIRVILRDARNPASCRTAFELALGNVAGMWQPHNPMPPSYSLNMFDLLAAFTPPVGGIKILAQFEFVGGWPIPQANYKLIVEDQELSSGESLQENLEKHALLVLERYFPISSGSASESYRSYRSLLLARVNSVEGTYCLRRLVELNEISIDDPRFWERLEKQPEALIAEMMLTIVGTELSNKQQILSALFSQALRRRVLEEFKSVCSQLNCELAENEDLLALNTPFESIDIKMDEEALKTFMRIRWDRHTSDLRTRELVGI